MSNYTKLNLPELDDSVGDRVPETASADWPD
jgi:hypothetical protein